MGGCAARWLCALLAGALAMPAAAAQAEAPLLVLLDGDRKQWEQWSTAAGWRFLAPWTSMQDAPLDARIMALEKRLAEERARAAFDPNRVYLAGQGGGVAALFYVASRVPDLWAAAVALGGTARPAVDSNRLFGANTTNLPVLWLSANQDDEALARRMQKAGYNLEFRVEPAATANMLFEWLAARRRDPHPTAADCETGATNFPRCYWITITGFDAAARNDALASTRVPPAGTGARLDLGVFGFSYSDPGPGVLVSWLPPNYRGPLRLDDRIVAVGGKPVRDAAAYIEMMDSAAEEKPAAVIIQRGKERLRQETRIVVPPREEVVTARVQGRYLPELGEIQVLSRAVSSMRLEVPAAWTGAALNWNGAALGKAEGAGCWLLEERKGLLAARRCP